MPLLKRLRTLAAAVESTVGTAETLNAAAGVFNAYEMEVQGDIDVAEREAQGSFNYLPGVSGSRKGSISFKTDVAWDGATSPVWATVLLTCCGWVESSQVFTPRSEALGANVKSATIGGYIDGVFKVLTGATGTWKLVAESGQVAMIEWNFDGVWVTPTDVAMIAPTYPTDVPLRFASGTVTYNSVAQTIANITVDAGNKIEMREDASTASGYISSIIVSRKPTITIDPEAQLVGTDPRYTQWVSNTEAAFSLVIDGPTGLVTNGNITISAPKAQITSVQEGDRNGIVTDDVEFACNKNGATADEELSITFTDKADA